MHGHDPRQAGDVKEASAQKRKKKETKVNRLEMGIWD